MKKSFFNLLLLMITSVPASSQEDLIVNIDGRETISLNGTWNYIIDPYETGFYNYRYKERDENDPEAYWNRPVVKKKTDRVEHGYQAPYTLQVPGDWNSQRDVFKYYEGSVWYQREFDTQDLAENERAYLYFGAVNYEAHVYLNGKKLGSHKGGFTPFNFHIPKKILKSENNFLVVKVDNKRHAQEIPTLNTDWWNFGGITRDVKLVVVPETFISQYELHLSQDQNIQQAKEKESFELEGRIQLNRAAKQSEVRVEIPELKLTKSFPITGDELSFNFEVKNLDLWSPDNPKLYDIVFSLNGNQINDKIGFRKIETSGKDILLNGENIFLRGISIHEEIAQDKRRAYSREDAEQLFGYVQDLNANMVRLAHYPHNENMTKVADSLGILVWSEIPVYWTIDFESEKVLDKAKQQLKEMVIRDRNKVSVIIWSVGNETPVSPTRNQFMKSLIDQAKVLDDTRLVSAALEVGYNEEGINHIDDPLGEYTDIVSVNEYLGWYGGLPDAAQSAQWEVAYNKPLFFSETGAGAKAGYHAEKENRWSEEYQEWFYKEQIAMMKRMPENYSGMSPWILTDFRSPRRNHPVYQEGWNRKGLIGNEGNKKKAFYILQNYYNELENQ
ncbi:beta galactosidase jelly roll domain-containing protein [Psychroflexus sp. CAK57W]|uniref:glycoside hydrolase family 2 protein n=1 Tax=Psychroflexus curvus TaxID=2873595 RepID=UPI001CCAD9EF|nr:glycoside hydrolase family 2 TIM barrel-domain containing protein [Psychroflexus curvus]MBZ9787637.1 beta galactosidase jelly roll domain-containing protein [Psychroflexus curvus]